MIEQLEELRIKALEKHCPDYKSRKFDIGNLFLDYDFMVRCGYDKDKIIEELIKLKKYDFLKNITEEDKERLSEEYSSKRIEEIIKWADTIEELQSILNKDKIFYDIAYVNPDWYDENWNFIGFLKK